MPLFSSRPSTDSRRIQVVSRRLAFSAGYSPTEARKPKKDHPSWYQHWAVRVEKIPNGGDESNPDTWDYFGLQRRGNRAFFDGSSFYPERVRNWGYTKLSAGEIHAKATALMAKSTKYNVVTSNCQDYVDSLAKMISNKWWAMSDETAAKWGVAGAYVGAIAVLL